MARQRRGGGFKPPELRGTLGTLLRTAAAQVGPLRDALERTAREGRSRLEDTLSSRRRNDALADLGEIVLDLIRRGEIDLAELPEVRDIVAHLDELDAGHSYEDDGDIAPPPVRNRFDSRPAPSPRGTPPRREDDGTTSSRNWSPPRPAKPAARVWRPPLDNEEGTPPPSPRSPARHAPARSTAPRKGGITFDDADEEPEPVAPAAGRLPKELTRKGGIDFDDDSDLAEYMHPDDVPAKKSDED